MITVRKVKHPYGLVVDGHAGSMLNDNNHDLVCCAVSTLMYTLVYSLRRQGVKIEYTVWDGHMELRVKSDREFNRDVAQSFLVVEHGLEMLATAYEENLKIIEH